MYMARSPAIHITGSLSTRQVTEPGPNRPCPAGRLSGPVRHCGLVSSASQSRYDWEPATIGVAMISGSS